MKTIFGSRKDHYLTRLSIFLITMALVAGTIGCDGDGGYNPPSTQNLEIRTWSDLDAIRDNCDGNHTLMNDLDSTTAGYEELASPTANRGKGWQPIVFRAYGFAGTAGRVLGVEGTFDGQGHEIRDLFINRPDEDFVGLFGSAYGVIKDISVVNATVTGRGTYSYSGGVGALVGANDGLVSNSYSTGTVTGGSSVGGLVGDNMGSVSNSFWDIETSGQSNSAGGTGKTTAQMRNIATFTGAGWNITAVANPSIRNPSYIWNIVDGVTYPFLSWQAI